MSQNSVRNMNQRIVAQIKKTLAAKDEGLEVNMDASQRLLVDTIEVGFQNAVDVQLLINLFAKRTADEYDIRFAK